MNRKLAKLVVSEASNRIRSVEHNPTDQARLLRIVSMRLMKEARQLDLQATNSAIADIERQAGIQ